MIATEGTPISNIGHRIGRKSHWQHLLLLLCPLKRLLSVSSSSLAINLQIEMGWIICWEIQLSFNFHTLRTHSIRPYENFQLQCFCTVNEITTCSTLAHINNRRLFLNLQPCLPTILFIAMLLFLAFLLGYLFHAKRPLGERVHFITTSMEKTGNKPCVLHTFSSTKLGYWLQWRLQNRAKFQVMLFCEANLVNFRCEEKYVRVQDCSLVYTQAFIYSFAQEDQQHAPHAWEADSVPTTARPQPQQASTSWSESTQIFSLELPRISSTTSRKMNLHTGVLQQLQYIQCACIFYYVFVTYTCIRFIRWFLFWTEYYQPSCFLLSVLYALIVQ